MQRARRWAVVTAAIVGLVACGSGGSSGGSSGKSTAGAGIKVADIVARTDASRQPIDAAPSPDGKVIYFATTGDTAPAIFSVPAGGGPMAKIAEGVPLTKPSGIAVATDGGHLFVADQQAAAAVAGSPKPGGAILSLATTATPEAPAALPGTAGWAPRGLDIVKQGGTDIAYFTGTDPASGAHGLFQVPAAGGTVTTVAEGAPFISPDSVAVTAQGVAYVSDQGSGPGQGQVFSVKGATVTSVLTGLNLGAPAGVALVNGEATLLISSIDATTRSDQVLVLDLATGKATAASKGIGENKNTSGGLHRALGSPVLAWCDVSRSGRIYRIEP